MAFIGQNLRFFRKMKGLSQQEFAEKIGLNRGNIASYEKGSAEPKATNLLKIAKFFNITLSDLIERDFSKEVEEGGSFEKSSSQGILLEPRSLRQVAELAHQEEGESLGVLADSTIEFSKIIEGFKNYHKYRMEKFKEENTSPDPQTLLYDYGQLLQVAEDLVHLNSQLLLESVS